MRLMLEVRSKSFNWPFSLFTCFYIYMALLNTGLNPTTVMFWNYQKSLGD